MKKIALLIFIAVYLTACSDRSPRHTGELPIIDIVGNAGIYQRVYLSEFFSSIELIPLETRDEGLLNIVPFPSVLVSDSIIIKQGGGMNRQYFAFGRSGQFLHQIGRRGQGPDEYANPGKPFLNAEQPTVFIPNIGTRNILEFDLNNGRFIRSFHLPDIIGGSLSRFAHIEANLFIGSVPYTGDNEYQYYLFDDAGTIIKSFPNHIFFHTERLGMGPHHRAFSPMRIDNRLYLKDVVNDTIYVFKDMSLQPAYVFDFGRFAFPIEYLGHFNPQIPLPRSAFILRDIVGTSRFFFYRMRIPHTFPKQRIRPRNLPFRSNATTETLLIYGIYDIARNTTVFLDTDQHRQQGIVNDINGGLSFIPRFYAGNGEVVDVWNPEDMLEMLTEEYFATKTIRNPEAHQRLREVLRNLEFDDNPVIVIARLKE